MSEQDKYDYNRFGVKAKRVGQAVYDILAKGDNQTVTAEEISESRQRKYLEDLKIAAERGKEKYTSPFYVVYLYNKEHWACNVMRGRFVPRQTEPIPENMMTMFPYFAKDVWKVDAEKGRVDYMWTLPALETFRQMTKHKSEYDPALAEWLKDPLAEKKPYSEISTG